MKNYQASQAARAVLVQGLQEANPKLVRGEGCVIAAKNIRIELKAAFPGVKFTVTTDRFAGGDAIRIGYVDGPVNDKVEEICGKYQAGSFNGMDDIYEFDNKNLWIDAFGSAKFVTIDRGFSDATINAAIVEVNEKYGETGATVGQYRNGELRYMMPTGMSNYDVQSLIYQAMRKMG